MTRVWQLDYPAQIRCCEAERELGAKATRRLRDLVRAGNLDFEYVACSCSAGTQGTPACNYGRDCGTLKSSGRDVGAILMEDGLAVPFVCGATRCPKTPRGQPHLARRADIQEVATYL